MDFSVFALAWPSIPIGNLGKGTNGGARARQMLRAAAAEVTGREGFDLFALYSNSIATHHSDTFLERNTFATSEMSNCSSSLL